MNPVTKRIVKIGVAVAAITASIYFSMVPNLTPMGTLCLCFILFAELELFGVIAIMMQFFFDRVSSLVRGGISFVAGLYSCCNVIVSISFMPYDSSYIKFFLTIQVALLIALVFMETFIILVSKLLHR